MSWLKKLAKSVMPQAGKAAEAAGKAGKRAYPAAGKTGSGSPGAAQGAALADLAPSFGADPKQQVRQGGTPLPGGGGGAAILTKVNLQGAIVKDLKEARADGASIKEAVAVLNQFKADYRAETGAEVVPADPLVPRSPEDAARMAGATTEQESQDAVSEAALAALEARDREREDRAAAAAARRGDRRGEGERHPDARGVGESVEIGATAVGQRLAAKDHGLDHRLAMFMIDKKETTRAPSMPDLPDVDHTGAGGAGGAGSSSSPHCGRAMPQKALEGVELVQDLENHNPRSGFEQPGRLTPEQVELIFLLRRNDPAVWTAETLTTKVPVPREQLSKILAHFNLFTGPERPAPESKDE